MSNQSQDLYEKISDLSRRRGIFWTSFEIYGGVAGFYDFGPVGVLIKRNIANQWLKHFVYTKENVVEVETPIINPRIVFKASGHEDHFTDPVVECLKCKRVYRADHLIKDLLKINVEGWHPENITNLIKDNNLKCPECGGELSAVFNALLLFTTQIGPYRGETAYLKPEHAQGMFINFPQLFKISRSKLPLGIAQIGRVSRNEISPRQGLLRLREFNIMEVEFFFDPEEADEEVKEVLEEIKDEKLRVITADMRLNNIEEPAEFTVNELINEKIVKTPWLAYWMGVGNRFLRSLGIPWDKIRFVEKLPHEKAHYSAQTFDQEVYTQRFEWVEVAGYAYRTTYDIERHAEYSGKDFMVFKRYEEPQVIVVEKVTPTPTTIEKMVGKENLGRVMRILSQIKPDDIAKELNTKGFIEVEGFKLPSECFQIKKEEVKVHGKKIYPHVVEPSFGLERLLYVVLEYSYHEREDKVVLRLPPYLAPYHVAVFPLLAGRKIEHIKMVSIARKIYKDLVNQGFRVLYDEEGSIGRRYARADEIGVPYAVTVDHQTIEDDTVTIRDRDTTEQIRIEISKITKFLLEKIGIGTLV
ncbi:MAG: glycine--tRNA ligase [Desulfurococcaceae archaeon]